MDKVIADCFQSLGDEGFCGVGGEDDDRVGRHHHPIQSVDDIHCYHYRLLDILLCMLVDRLPVPYPHTYVLCVVTGKWVNSVPIRAHEEEFPLTSSSSRSSRHVVWYGVGISGLLLTTIMLGRCDAQLGNWKRRPRRKF